MASGTRLGAYEVVSLLGQGGMGEVYRARDTKLNRDVALKILPEAFTLDGDRIARFRREAQVLASLNHPNIAAIYGFEDSGSTHALVLELVEGPTLADRIAKGPIPLEEALPIAKQIAEALEAAHEQGIVHRDLKPANIKVRDDGTVKVLDFGLAKAMEPVSAISPALTASPTITTPAQMTGIGMILGTAAYMSPEQAKGRPADKRSDVWAFGCVLFEMLTGKRAFDGEDVSDTLASVLRGEPDWNALPRSLPAAVRLLIRRCLTKDRQQRIHDMAVAQFVIAEPASFVAAVDARAGSSARRPRWMSSVVLAGAVVLTAIVASVVAWRVKPPVARQVVRFSIVSTKDDPLANAGRQLVAISPDGTQVVYATSGRSRLFLRSLSDNEGHAIPGTEGRGVHSPAFSPDGRELVYFDSGSLKRVAVSGGAPVPVCSAVAPFGVTWDASGIIFGQGRRGILRCSPNGGTPEQLITVKQDEFAHGPQLLPDGDHLLFTIAKADNTQTGWDRAQIVVQSLKSGQRKLLVNNGSDGRYLPTGHLLYAVGGVAMAIAFNPDRLETSGAPASVISGVGRARGAATGMAHMAVASSGTLVYVPGPPDPAVNLHQLALATRDGVVTALKVLPGPYTHVRASHDGKQLAVGSDEGKEAIVWIYDLSETSAIRRLTIEGMNRFPIWSPSNQRIAFQSDREGDFAIFTQLSNGTGPVERLTKPQKGERHFPGSWSSDGNHLAFTVEREGEGYSLWILSLPDKKMTRFGQVSSIEPIEPVFSPDDRWIAYTSTSAESAGRGFTQNRGVFIEPFPWTGSRYQAPKLQIDFHPLWSPDRRWLFYMRTAASGEVTAVPVSLEPDVKFGSPELIRATVNANRLSNENRAFDILPDGRFAGLTSPGGSSVSAITELRLDFALNWFEELKQRVPTK